MTEATNMGFTLRRAADVRLVAGVSAAHFVSHFYMLVLPPLFAFVRLEYAVSYTELGLMLTIFNAVTALLQTHAGFLTDRFNARWILIAGLLLGAAAFAVIAATRSYWVMVAMFAVAGIGNTVYHPADYALLSRHIAPERISQAYSAHTFAGMLGTAAAPAVMLLLQQFVGWRAALLGATALGIAVALALALQRDPPPIDQAPRPREAAAGTGWRLLLSPPIMVNFVFFALLAFGNFGLTSFGVVALGALHGTPLDTANTALSSNLFMTAIGVLLGGLIAAQSRRHNLVAALGLLGGGVLTILLGEIRFDAMMLVLMMGLTGLAFGVIAPSRDMIVRAATPPGAFGKVFGFVTNGFNIGGILSPILFGALMDRGEPRLVFWIAAASAFAGIVAVVSVPKRLAV